MRGFFAVLSKMKYIDRWGLMRCTRKENLSEHCLEVAMLTHALIAIANERLGEQLDAGEGVLYALYHDASEIITGDLPTPIKYHDPAIKAAYKSIESQAVEKLIAMLPEDLSPSFAKYFAGNDKLEPYVKAADKLSAVIKCIEERAGGNREFLEAEKACLSHESLKLPAAKIFIEEFLPAYELTLDEVSRYE